MFDQFPRDDGIELATQIERFGVAHADISIPALLQHPNAFRIEIDAPNVIKLPDKMTMQPRRSIYWRRDCLESPDAADVEHGRTGNL